jgi:hypothetical protein
MLLSIYHPYLIWTRNLGKIVCKPFSRIVHSFAFKIYLIVYLRGLVVAPEKWPASTVLAFTMMGIVIE